MNKPYLSPSARRGLLIAVVTAGMWVAWAFGYSQGMDVKHPQMPLISINKKTVRK